MIRVKRHADRTSISFAPDGADVDWIVTVTFDNRLTKNMDDDAIVVMARSHLDAFIAAKRGGT